MSRFERTQKLEALFKKALGEQRLGFGIQSFPNKDSTVIGIGPGTVSSNVKQALELLPETGSSDPGEFPGTTSSKANRLNSFPNFCSFNDPGSSLTEGEDSFTDLSRTLSSLDDESTMESLSHSELEHGVLRTMFLDRRHVLNALMSADDFYPYVFLLLEKNEVVATGKFFGLSLFELLDCGFGNDFDKVRLFGILRGRGLISQEDSVPLSNALKRKLRLGLSLGMKYMSLLHAADKNTYLRMREDGNVPEGDFFGMSPQFVVKSGYGSEDDKEALCALLNDSSL